MYTYQPCFLPWMCCDLSGVVEGEHCYQWYQGRMYNGLVGAMYALTGRWVMRHVRPSLWLAFVHQIIQQGRGAGGGV